MKRLTSMLVLISSMYGSAAIATDNDQQLAIDKTYIAGFLAGAQLSDSKIMQRFEELSSVEQQSNFFQRAFKTRVGDRAEPLPATYYAGFCLPDKPVDDEIISAILAETKVIESNTSLDKADLVFKAVTARYPCEER